MSRPVLQVFSDEAALHQAAAQYFIQIARAAVATRGRFSVALAGGSTPEELYRLLAQSPYKRDVLWPQTHIFWGDERLVPPDDAGSNYGQAAAWLLDQVPVLADNVYRAKGELDPAAAVADYTGQLRNFAGGQRAWPRFDLVLLGLGSDGHTASLFPGPISDEEREQTVIAVTAGYDGRPAHRLTLTPLIFNDARNVIFLVSGAKKAEALAAVLKGPRDLEQWPAQRIQPEQGRLIWLVDEAAAGHLPDRPLNQPRNTP